MGNNTTSNKPLPTMGEDIGNIFDSYNTEEFTTHTGEKIQSNGYTREFLEKLNTNIELWIEYGVDRITFFMSPEEIQYIHDHMEPSASTAHFTRVEPQRFFDRENYQVGDILKDDTEYRSFSRNNGASLRFIEQNKHYDDYITIYRTHGQVQHFNATQWANKYEWEEESFINPTSLKITKIQHFEGQESLPQIAQAIGAKNINNTDFPKDVYVVDVEQV